MSLIIVRTGDRDLYASVQQVLAENFPGIAIQHEHAQSELPIRPPRLILPTQHEIEVVPLAHVIRVEGFKSYSTFYLQERRSVTVSKNLVNFERLLPSPLFLRVHKSHIVNLDCVLRFRRQGTGLLQMDDDSEVPVSPDRRGELLQLLGQYV
jgi:two-component system, LytTR family, response regulator